MVFIQLSVTYYPGLWTPLWCECTHGRGAEPGMPSDRNPQTTSKLVKRWSDLRGIRQPLCVVRIYLLKLFKYILNKCSDYFDALCAENFNVEAAIESIKTIPKCFRKLKWLNLCQILCEEGLNHLYSFGCSNLFKQQEHLFYSCSAAYGVIWSAAAARESKYMCMRKS